MRFRALYSHLDLAVYGITHNGKMTGKASLIVLNFNSGELVMRRSNLMKLSNDHLTHAIAIDDSYSPNEITIFWAGKSVMSSLTSEVFFGRYTQSTAATSMPVMVEEWTGGGPTEFTPQDLSIWKDGANYIVFGAAAAYSAPIPA